MIEAACVRSCDAHREARAGAGYRTPTRAATQLLDKLSCLLLLVQIKVRLSQMPAL